MVKNRFLRMFLMCLLAWTIFNSQLLVQEIYFICSGEWREAWDWFVEGYCLGGLWYEMSLLWKLDQSGYPWTLYPHIMAMFMLYEIIITGSALRFWWRKPTVPRAFPLALAGVVAGPSLILFFSMHSAPRIPCLLAMAVFYAILGRICKKRQQAPASA